MNNQFEIIETSEGFMPLNKNSDEYLHDEYGNNCFTLYSEAINVINKTILNNQSKII